ncbi:MAG: zinc ribbon domain-containing protein [Defluviitaleaceae bacterium]|nr:zinc ribbon domain-containing protein [Defluviitaleaceae bacterium]MCL2274233.1 zinc ribbon domain-containing protein [Defluviitaleaceae bacterium]
MNHCQSCYMPLKEAKDHGTNTDGGQNADYCVHCYAKGKFTYESTLEQAVENNIPWWRDGCANDDEARAKIMEVFPTLKRWAKV